MNWEAVLWIIFTFGFGSIIFSVIKKEIDRQKRYNKKIQDHYKNVRRELYKKLKYIGPNWIEEIEKDFGPIKPSVKRQFYASQSHHITKLPPVKIQRTCKPLTETRKWKKQGNYYNGYYRTKYGSYRGLIEYLYENKWRFMIFNTPKCLDSHVKKHCFFPQGKNSYEVHFHIPPKNIDDGIRSIENILTEAHEGRNLR